MGQCRVVGFPLGCNRRRAAWILTYLAVMKSRQSIRIQRSFENQETVATLWGAGAAIKIRISGPSCARQRRAIAVSFFRHIRPFFEFFREGTIDHLHDGRTNFYRNEQRGLNLFDSSSFNHPGARAGFRIRMLRLELGWSQKELSRHARVCRSQLSEIERGNCLPRLVTLKNIERALRIRREAIRPIRAGRDTRQADIGPHGTFNTWRGFENSMEDPPHEL